MARARVAKLAFNRGLVSRLGLARADIKRLAMAAEDYVNWMPRVLGSMMLRPGKAYLGSSLNDAQALYIPFVFSISDKALVELTTGKMRVWVNDAVITRGSVSSAVANGTFDANLGSWTDSDEAGGTSAWVSGGYMGLTGNGSAAAIRDQEVTVAAGDQNDEHALKIVIQRGPVILRVGSALGGDQYISETELDTGEHSLAFTPTGNFFIRFMSRLKRQVLVNSVAVEAAGAMSLNTPWVAADLDLVRANQDSQSGDIIFTAAAGYQQRKIERRGTRSWSCVRYQADDGPFLVENFGPITLTPAALTGNTTLTASAAYFKSTMAPSTNNDGALFSVMSSGQTVTATVTAEDTFTDAIRVTGAGSNRDVVLSVSGTYAAILSLQRATLGSAGPWTSVAAAKIYPYTYNDGLDGQTVWYRFGVATGGYTSGTAELQLSSAQGFVRAMCRVTGFTSVTVVDVEVIVDFGATSASNFWAEGAWSDLRGWPSVGALHEGRLGWAGNDGVWLSISDNFYGFDQDFEGDAGPISRTIGAGPVDTIAWMLPLQRLMLGGQGTEFSVRSSSLDEPLTPTNFNLKPASSQGSALVPAVKVDQNGIFVQRGGARAYELAFGEDGIDYQASHLSALVPEIGLPEIIKIAVQRQPDTRIHFLRSDGTVAVLIFDKLENVICWIEVETAASGVIEDIVILPGDSGDEEDHVYYSVRRTINSATKRYLEKWAFESECRGSTLNRQADSFVTYSQTASSTITGLSHLIGASVVVWDNGKCLRDADGAIATFTVNGSGEITVTNAGAAYSATTGVVGLSYTASWRSAKFVEMMEAFGGSLSDNQLIKGLGLILADTHAKGLKYGQSLTEADMNDLPEIGNEGEVTDADTVHTEYTTPALSFPGKWSKDARLCLLAKAPRPCTVLAAIAEVEHHAS